MQHEHPVHGHRRDGVRPAGATGGVGRGCRVLDELVGVQVPADVRVHVESRKRRRELDSMCVLVWFSDCEWFAASVERDGQPAPRFRRLDAAAHGAQ